MKPTMGMNASTIIHASRAAEDFLSKNRTAKINMKFTAYMIAGIEILLSISAIFGINQIIYSNSPSRLKVFDEVILTLTIFP